MKKQHTKIERIVKKAVTHMVDTELYEWPPKCAAFLYQPTRPKSIYEDALKNSYKIRK